MQTISQVNPVEETATVKQTPRELRPALVVGTYFVVGILWYWRSYGQFTKPIITNLDNYDFAQSVWFLAWIPHAVAHGLNPFFSNALMAPSGVNLAQNTASPLLGLLTAPLSLFFGPITRANLIVVLAMPLSATSAFLVLRKWKVVVAAAALGGFVFGFSSYMVEHNVELIFLPLVPLIAGLLVSIVNGGSSYVRLGIGLGLLVTAQYLISPEVLVIVLIFAFVGIALVWIRAPRVVARNSWRPLALAVAISGSLLAYPIWMMTAGPQHFTGRTWATGNSYHDDALSVFIPGPEQQVTFGLHSIGRTISGASGAIGAGAYIGIVLLAIAGYLAWRSRRQVRTQIAFLLMVLAMILSLGPYLDIDGHQSHFPLPFLLLDHVGMLDDILPDRVCFVTIGCVAALIAFGFDDLLKTRTSTGSSHEYRRMGSREFALFAGVIVGVFISTPLPSEPSLPVTVSLPIQVQKSIPNDDPITITYPVASSLTTETMLWQANDGFGFRLIGGYAYHPTSEGGPTLNPGVMQPRGLQQFLAREDKYTAYALTPIYGEPLPLGRALVTAARATLQKYDVQLIIVDTRDSGSKAVVNLFTEALGAPSVVRDPFDVWVGKRGAT